MPRILNHSTGAEHAVTEEWANYLLSKGGYSLVEQDATDAAKALASEAGISLSEVEGSGSGGRIIKRDIEALL